MKTFYIENSKHPCTELVLEVNQIRQYLVAAGLSETENSSEADYLFVSTCAFNQEYEDNALEQIGQAKSHKKDDAQIIVSGCLSKINPQAFAQLQVDDLPPLEMEKIEKLIPSKNSIHDFPANYVTLKEYKGNDDFMAGIKIKKVLQGIHNVLPIPLPAWLEVVPMTDWFFVRASHGCLGKCSYCAIKRSRGSLKSFDLDSILKQIKTAVKKGHKNISFAGDDLGCWGQDKGSDLPTLLKEVVKVEGDFKVDIRFIEPDWLVRYYSQLEDVFRTGKIASFTMPIQSGSQRIIELMDRHYKIEDVIDVSNRIINSTKVKGLSSIIMTGFPTETTEDYLKSYELLNKSQISLWRILKYEGRPFTRSESLERKVPEDVKELRAQRLIMKNKLYKIGKLPESLSESIVKMKFGKQV